MRAMFATTKIEFNDQELRDLIAALDVARSVCDQMDRVGHDHEYFLARLSRLSALFKVCADWPQEDDHAA
jgi:hypothetical protein